MSKEETYISIDIETDGPCPGINSMLALGAIAFRKDTEFSPRTGHFYCHIKPEEGAVQNKDTLGWWATQPEAWNFIQHEQVAPENATQQFCEWLDGWTKVSDKLVAVAWPAAFDFAFVNHYCWKYQNRNPLGFACIDIRSYAAGLLGRSTYYGLPEEAINSIAGPKRSDLRAHHALDDAIEQADLFKALLRTADTPVHWRPRP